MRLWIRASRNESNQTRKLHSDEVVKQKGRLIDQIEISDVPSPWLWPKVAVDFLRRETKQQQEAENICFRDLLIELKSCSKRKDLQQGRKIHVKAVGSRNDKNTYVVTALVNMYAKCGSMLEARDVFDSVRKPDMETWTALLLGYADNGDGIVALEMFSRMKARGCRPDSVAYIAALKACTSLAVNGDASGKAHCLEQGREIHSNIGCHLIDSYVQSTLIDMYTKCGSMVDARRVFDSIQKPDVVSWNALLLGYANNGEGLVALEMFSRMKMCGCGLDSVTYIAALKACTSLAVNGEGGCLERGREIHSQIGCHLDHFVKNTLIDMYSKCGSMVDARAMFHSVKKPDVVSWNALILGYADNGDGLAALEMLSRMKAHGCQPEPVTHMAALKACGLIGALPLGRKFHLEISDIHHAYVLTCLVDFYAKCGSMVEARDVFDLHSKLRVTSTWNALLAGYGSLGDSDSVFNVFKAMQDEGFPPDAVTFVCVLLCCSHAGLVEKAREYFEAMPLQYRINPTVMHYTCMVDILGRVNQLNEAIAMIRKMPCNPNTVTWTALLGACRRWKNVKIGKSAFQSLVDIDKTNAHAYVVMGHLYGSVGMWEEQERVLQIKTQVGAWRLPGQAYVIDDKGKMVKFVLGEQDSTEVEQMLERLCESIKAITDPKTNDQNEDSTNSLEFHYIIRRQSS